MRLLIDDVRDLKYDCIARNAKTGKFLLQVGGWDCVCFDHDLGGKITGYDLLCYAIDNNLLPKEVQIVTMNPVGRLNMSRALIAAKYRTKDQANFYKK